MPTNKLPPDAMKAKNKSKNKTDSNTANASDSTTEPSCMDDFDPHSMLVDDALACIDSSIDPITESQTLPLRDALSRILATPVNAAINVPSYTNSAMDGYAILSSDIPATGLKQLTLVATVLAGSPTSITIQPGECARIMTGGKMPDGTDTVVMQERVQVNNTLITINTENSTGQNVRHAGEDISVGEKVLSTGKLLTPADLGLLASIGIANVNVIRKVRVAFLSTGDELKPVGGPLSEGEIYDSNRYTLFGMLQRFGAEISDLGVIRDDPQSIRLAIESAAENADVLITSGGVSVGDADYVKQTLEAIGNVSFWKVAMKPGRPLAYGNIKKGTVKPDNIKSGKIKQGNIKQDIQKQCLFFGLPGNPVSAMVTFYQFVLPALNRLSGQQPHKPLLIKLPCISTLNKSPGRVEYQRGRIEVNDDGNYVVKSVGQQGSGILSSMSKANCFIILPLEAGTLPANTTVTVQPFDGLI